MLTLYHSPQSRSTRVIGLLMAMGKLDDVTIKTVHVQRQDGSGAKSPDNPHPDGKVPALMVDGEIMRETNAIMLFLTDHFGGPMGRAVGEAGRGTYLTWLAWYGNVLEPVMVADYAGFGDNPMFISTFRGMGEVIQVLETALADTPFLMGQEVTAVDFLCASPFQWAPNIVPETGPIADWAKRVSKAVDHAALEAFEAAAMSKLGLT